METAWQTLLVSAACSVWEPVFAWGLLAWGTHRLTLPLHAVQSLPSLQLQGPRCFIHLMALYLPFFLISSNDSFFSPRLPLMRLQAYMALSRVLPPPPPMLTLLLNAVEVLSSFSPRCLLWLRWCLCCGSSSDALITTVSCFQAVLRPRTHQHLALPGQPANTEDAVIVPGTPCRFQREFWCGTDLQIGCAIYPLTSVLYRRVCIKVEGAEVRTVQRRYPICDRSSKIGCCCWGSDTYGAERSHQSTFPRVQKIDWCDLGVPSRLQGTVMHFQKAGYGWSCLSVLLRQVRGEYDWKLKVNLRMVPIWFKWLWEARLCAVYFKEKIHCACEVSAPEQVYPLQMLIQNPQCGWDPIW